MLPSLSSSSSFSPVSLRSDVSSSACIPKTIQLSPRFHYHTIGYFLQEFLLKFGLISVLAKYLDSFLHIFHNGFCACCQHLAVVLHRKIKCGTLQTERRYQHHGTKRRLQHQDPPAHPGLSHPQPPARGQRVQYPRASRGREHLHLKCVRCGRIYHLDCHFMDEVRAHLMAEHGFTLQCEGSVLYGLCRSCAANEAEDGQAAQTCKNCCADVDTDKKQ